jgi:hypothetical protein
MKLGQMAQRGHIDRETFEKNLPERRRGGGATQSDVDIGEQTLARAVVGCGFQMSGVKTSP